MKKAILAILLSLVVSNIYSYTTYTIEEPAEYVVYDDLDVIYDEPVYVYEEPVYVRPVARKRVVYRQPRRVVHCVESDPVASIFSGLAGFAVGTAVGAAIAD
jgi:hypothetical protein